MKKLLFILFAFTLLSVSSGQSSKVYVCGNGTTKVFHANKNCHGLKRCSYKHIEMTKEEAFEDGLRLCGYED